MATARGASGGGDGANGAAHANLSLSAAYGLPYIARRAIDHALSTIVD
jgi:hypothetical protein